LDSVICSPSGCGGHGHGIAVDVGVFMRAEPSRMGLQFGMWKLTAGDSNLDTTWIDT
jgi:hypothetical protein